MLGGLPTELRVVIPLTMNLRLGDVWTAMTGGDGALPPQTGVRKRMPFFHGAARMADRER